MGWNIRIMVVDKTTEEGQTTLQNLDTFSLFDKGSITIFGELDGRYGYYLEDRFWCYLPKFADSYILQKTSQEIIDILDKDWEYLKVGKTPPDLVGGFTDLIKWEEDIPLLEEHYKGLKEAIKDCPISEENRVYILAG